jgi:hypothetical protein
VTTSSTTASANNLKTITTTVNSTSTSFVNKKNAYNSVNTPSQSTSDITANVTVNVTANISPIEEPFFMVFESLCQLNTRLQIQYQTYCDQPNLTAKDGLIDRIQSLLQRIEQLLQRCQHNNNNNNHINNNSNTKNEPENRDGEGEDDDDKDENTTMKINYPQRLTVLQQQWLQYLETLRNNISQQQQVVENEEVHEVIEVDQLLSAMLPTASQQTQSAPSLLLPNNQTNNETQVISSQSSPRLGIVATSVTETTKPSADTSEQQQPEETSSSLTTLDPATLTGWYECLYTTMFATAAHHAAYHNFTGVLNFLSQYFDCFIMDEYQRTPLYYAAYNNHLESVALLLLQDPRWIDVGDYQGNTLLHAAALAAGRVEHQQYRSKQQKSKVNATKNNQSNDDEAEEEVSSTAVLEFLLSCDAHPDTANYLGLTPAHVTTSKAALIVLSRYQAQFHCIDTRDRMPLHYALTRPYPRDDHHFHQKNRIELVNFLLTQIPREFLTWPEKEEGNTILHLACQMQDVSMVETICAFYQQQCDNTNNNISSKSPSSSQIYDLDALYHISNTRGYLCSHLVTDPAVFRVLYEYGLSLYEPDRKSHMPLFLCAYHGQSRYASLVYLLESAITRINQATIGSKSRPSSSNGSVLLPAIHSSSLPTTSSSTGSKIADIHTGVFHVDEKGDSALHIAGVGGFIPTVITLLFFLPNAPNKQGLTPSHLALKAGHIQISQCIESTEKYVQEHLPPETTTFTSKSPRQMVTTSSSSSSNLSYSLQRLNLVETFFGCTMIQYTDMLIHAASSRWSKCYDASFDAIYYFDHITSASQWDCPITFDMNKQDSLEYDQALELLKRFYFQYNPEKLKDVNDILFVYRRRYEELFQSLAKRYQVTDLTMFSGFKFSNNQSAN